MIAVTGTNGKTTVTTLIKQVLEYTGAKVGLIGTIQNEIGEVKLPAKFTTPEPDDLHGLLANMCRAGCEYAVMEASSQALDQNRLAGVTFQVGAFTKDVYKRQHLEGEPSLLFQSHPRGRGWSAAVRRASRRCQAAAGRRGEGGIGKATSERPSLRAFATNCFGGRRRPRRELCL